MKILGESEIPSNGCIIQFYLCSNIYSCKNPPLYNIRHNIKSFGRYSYDWKSDRIRVTLTLNLITAWLCSSSCPYQSDIMTYSVWDANIDISLAWLWISSLQFSRIKKIKKEEQSTERNFKISVTEIQLVGFKLIFLLADRPGFQF